MLKFTIVLPVRDTDQEYKFLKKSLPSALAIKPDELIIGADAPLSPRLAHRIAELCKVKDPKTEVRILPVDKDATWNFQLANVMWNCYTFAKYDYILSFDVDSILRPIVLMGLEQIAKDGTAVVSFTKRLRIKTPGELLRHIFYRLRVMQTDYVFSGVYWIYRPYYFENVPLEKYKTIYNGVDTIMCNEILDKKKHRIVTNKETGVDCLDIQNEDLPWRQYQTGIWIWANRESFMQRRLEYIKKRKQQLPKRKAESFARARGPKSLLIRKARFAFIEFRMKIFEHPFIQNQILKHIETRSAAFLLVKTIAYWHPHLLLGYLWAKKHPNSEAVKMAKQLDQYEWGFQGSKYVTHKKWKREGTGFNNNH